MPRDEHIAAKDRMIQGIRDAVDDDFLILVTTGNDIMTTRHHAEYINGFFMETTENYVGGYTHAGLLTSRTRCRGLKKTFERRKSTVWQAGAIATNYWILREIYNGCVCGRQ